MRNFIPNLTVDGHRIDREAALSVTMKHLATAIVLLLIVQYGFACESCIFPDVHVLPPDSVVLSWVTSVPLNTQVWYGQGTGMEYHYADWTLTTHHTARLVGLKPYQKYTVVAESTYYSSVEMSSVRTYLIMPGPPWPDIRDFGAVGDGTTDDTAAFQLAVDSGRPFTVSPGRYRLVARPGRSAITYSGKVVMYGNGRNSVIVCDGMAFSITNAGQTHISNLSLRSETNPVTVTPDELPTSDPNEIVAIDRYGHHKGYLPTVNDIDIIGKLSFRQLNDDISTGIVLAGGDHAIIDNVTGKYASIIIYDCSYCTVSHDTLMGGKNFGGCILEWRGTTASPGNRYSVIDHNNVSYCSFSGIAIGGARNVFVWQNSARFNGESGIKTWQGYPEQVRNALIAGNMTEYNFYDGLDISSSYPHTGIFDAHSTAIGNYSIANRRAGIWGDGLHWNIKYNTVIANGLSGLALDVSDSVISRNVIQDNNALSVARGVHQLALGISMTAADDIVIDNIIRADATTPGYGIYSTGDNIVKHNIVIGPPVHVEPLRQY